MVRLDSIVHEETKKDIAVIYYYQVLKLDDENPVRQSLKAYFKKTGQMWKIILVEDGKEDEEPFIK